jgi:hypothetical protein
MVVAAVRHLLCVVKTEVGVEDVVEDAVQYQRLAYLMMLY